MTNAHQRNSKRNVQTPKKVQRPNLSAKPSLYQRCLDLDVQGRATDVALKIGHHVLGAKQCSLQTVARGGQIGCVAQINLELPLRETASAEIVAQPGGAGDQLQIVQRALELRVE